MFVKQRCGHLDWIRRTRQWSIALSKTSWAAQLLNQGLSSMELGHLATRLHHLRPEWPLITICFDFYLTCHAAGWNIHHVMQRVFCLREILTFFIYVFTFTDRPVPNTGGRWYCCVTNFVTLIRLTSWAYSSRKEHIPSNVVHQALWEGHQLALQDGIISSCVVLHFAICLYLHVFFNISASDNPVLTVLLRF